MEPKYSITSESCFILWIRFMSDDNSFIAKCICLQSFYKINWRCSWDSNFIVLYFFVSFKHSFYLYLTHFINLFLAAARPFFFSVNSSPSTNSRILFWFISILAVSSINIEFLGRQHSVANESLDQLLHQSVWKTVLLFFHADSLINHLRFNLPICN